MIAAAILVGLLAVAFGLLRVAAVIEYRAEVELLLGRLHRPDADGHDSKLKLVKDEDHG